MRNWQDYKIYGALEVRIGDAWMEVIRYDCLHDYAHKDCYNIKGECRKINLYLDYEDALTLADDDINENWEIYKERFLRIPMMDKRRFVEKNSMLVKEFDRYIFEHPEFADKIPNNALVVMQIEGDEEFNKWAREMAQNVAEKDTSLCISQLPN